MNDGILADSSAELIGAIYEAGAIPELWPAALQTLAGHVGAVGGNLICQTKAGLLLRSSPSVEQISREFAIAGFNESNSRVSRLLEKGQHPGFLTDSHLHDEYELRQLPIYRDFLDPRGFAAGAATVIPGAGSEAMIVALEAFADHPASRRAVPELDRLRPHLARAAVLSGRIYDSRVDSVTDAFDAVDTAFGILDERGRLLKASGHFQKRMNGIMVDAPARLRLLDPSADQRFATCLASGKGFNSGCSVALRGKGGCAVLQVIPASGNSIDLFNRAAFFVLLSTGDNALLPSADTIASLFDLTPAEARVARGVAQGKSPAVLAAEFGLSTETVRTHLKRAMGKTSTRRQSELSALLGRLR